MGIKMSKKGRPWIHKKQRRISISLSDSASEILESAKEGRKSELFSLLVETYSNMFPHFFIKKVNGGRKNLRH
jgi:hypothetical protein